MPGFHRLLADPRRPQVGQLGSSIGITGAVGLWVSPSPSGTLSWPYQKRKRELAQGTSVFQVSVLCLLASCWPKHPHGRARSRRILASHLAEGTDTQANPPQRPRLPSLGFSMPFLHISECRNTHTCEQRLVSALKVVQWGRPTYTGQLHVPRGSCHVLSQA